MDVRLRDVAERAGVSVKTVSNVVNDPARVAPATRARVQRVIDELGYRPNLSARQLRTGRTGVITLAVPNLVTPYFAELATAIITEARKHSVTVLIEHTGGDRASERAIAEGLGSTLIDGVILSPLALSETALAEVAGRVPLVLLGERDYRDRYDHVRIDNVAAAREATEHLLGLGRRRIAVIGATTGPTGSQRLAGCQAALAAAGIQMPPELAPPTTGYTRAGGAKVMRGLLDLPHRPDAVFCCNDLLALGALRIILSAGLRVPRDVALVGFDDSEDGRYSTPTLTTVAPAKTQIARYAVTLLLDQITGTDPDRHPVLVQAGHTLLRRESTAGPAT